MKAEKGAIGKRESEESRKSETRKTWFWKGLWMEIQIEVLTLERKSTSLSEIRKVSEEFKF